MKKILKIGTTIGGMEDLYTAAGHSQSLPFKTYLSAAEQMFSDEAFAGNKIPVEQRLAVAITESGFKTRIAYNDGIVKSIKETGRGSTAVGFFQLIIGTYPSRDKELLEYYNQRAGAYGLPKHKRIVDMHESSVLAQTLYFAGYQSLEKKKPKWLTPYQSFFYNATASVFAVHPKLLTDMNYGKGVALGYPLNDGNFFHNSEGRPYGGWVGDSFPNPNILIDDWAWAIYTIIQWHFIAERGYMIDFPLPYEDEKRRDLALRIALSEAGSPNKKGYLHFRDTGSLFRGELVLLKPQKPNQEEQDLEVESVSSLSDEKNDRIGFKVEKVDDPNALDSPSSDILPTSKIKNI